MTRRFRGLLLASLSLTVLTLGACSSTGENVSNASGASRVDSILQRAAQQARASGNKVETIALLEKIYERNPDDSAVATALGQALREDEQLNRARQVLYPYTEGKNAAPDAITELSMVQLALGQYKDAENSAQRAIEMDGDEGRPYLALGTALDAQNKHEDAEAAFREGIDLWKGDPAPIMNNLALNLASQNKLDQAIDMLQKAKAVSPGRIELERNMRIITTLKESADDFIIKQEQEKKAVVVEKKATPEPIKVEIKEAEKAVAAKVEPVKAEALKEPVKEAVKAAPKPQKIEPAASPAKTNMRGSRQNFGGNKKSEE